MTSQERKAARIERDKQQKAKKRIMRNQEIGSTDKIFSEQHFMNSMIKCCENTSWKGSTQKYEQHGIVKNHIASQAARQGTLKVGKDVKNLVIVERGKTRNIKAVNIDDRVLQRTICDYALVPMYERILIYDNPASMKGKGISFARYRVGEMIHGHVLRNGTEGYAALFDFKSFFNSIPHSTCYNVLSKEFMDEIFINLVMDIVKSYQNNDIMNIKDKKEREKQRKLLEKNKGVGITLGSQISQILALAVPNKIDHYIKDVMRVKYYLRYMDDGIIIHKSKEFLKKILHDIDMMAKELGLTLNMKKTRIVKLTHGFTFLKIKYYVTDTGKIVKRLVRQSKTRMRRKLKKFVHLIKENKMTYDDAYNSFMSWYGNSFYTRSYFARKSMLELYNKLFNNYRTVGLKPYSRKIKRKVKIQYGVL